MEFALNLLELMCWSLLLVFIGIAIVTELRMYIKKMKNQKQIETLISDNKCEIEALQVAVKALLKSQYLQAGDAQIRDYFVRTKYIGRLEDKKLIEDYKKAVGDFEAMKNDLLNYKNVENFVSYRETLTKFEYQQLVLDMYAPKKEAK